MSDMSKDELVTLLKKCERLIESKEFLEVESILDDFPQLKEFFDNDNSLLFCCFPDNLTFLKRLISLGVDPNIQDTVDSTHLITFSSLGNVEMVDFLLKNGADPNIKTNLGETAFSFACYSNEFECAKLLQGYGANINCVVGGNCTPMDWALTNASNEFIDWLKQLGAKSYSEMKS